MKAIRWNPDQLLKGADRDSDRLSDLVHSAQQGRRMKVLIERVDSGRLLRDNERSALYQAQFRRGCVGIVQARLAPSAQRSRIISEIHRRLDSVMNGDDRSWEDEIGIVFAYVGAWVLAADLQKEGVSVCVIGEGQDEAHPAGDPARTDVEIVLPIGPRERAS